MDTAAVCFVVIILMNLLIAIMSDSCETNPMHKSHKLAGLEACWCTHIEWASFFVRGSDEKIKESENLQVLR